MFSPIVTSPRGVFSPAFAVLALLLCALAFSGCATRVATPDHPVPVACTGRMKITDITGNASCFRFQAPEMVLAEAARAFVDSYPLVASGSYRITRFVCVGRDMVFTESAASFCSVLIEPLEEEYKSEYWSLTFLVPREVTDDPELYSSILDGAKLGDIFVEVVIDSILVERE